jgi:hypothetical protein
VRTPFFPQIGRWRPWASHKISDHSEICPRFVNSLYGRPEGWESSLSPAPRRGTRVANYFYSPTTYMRNLSLAHGAPAAIGQRRPPRHCHGSCVRGRPSLRLRTAMPGATPSHPRQSDALALSQRQGELLPAARRRAIADESRPRGNRRRGRGGRRAELASERDGKTAMPNIFGHAIAGTSNLRSPTDGIGSVGAYLGLTLASAQELGISDIALIATMARRWRGKSGKGSGALPGKTPRKRVSGT